jgi:hypothetical protein
MVARSGPAVLENNVTLQGIVKSRRQLVNFNALRLGRVIDAEFPIWRSQARDGGPHTGIANTLEALIELQLSFNPAHL